MKNNILLVDDDDSVRFVIGKYLGRLGYNVRATDNVQTLLKWTKSGIGDVLITDVHLGRDDIFDSLPDIKKLRPDLPLIIISANTNVMTAIKSSKHKVFAYVPKPFDLDEIGAAVKSAIGATPVITGARNPTNEHHRLIGKSEIMQPVFRALADQMSSPTNVHVYGGPGSGKTLIATLMHEEGDRADLPLITFGRNANTFDLLSLLSSGDLLVERVDELSPSDQTDLLEVLERAESLSKKFKLISTSQYSFSEIVHGGLLRPELAAYLSGGEIFLPPLRLRADDIGVLAQWMYAQNTGGRKAPLNTKIIDSLSGYSWPGNVRELSNFMQKICGGLAKQAPSQRLVTQLLAQHLGSNTVEVQDIRQMCKDLLVSRQAKPGEAPHSLTIYQEALAWVEKPLIEEALRQTNGNNLRAAELLGIHRNTLRTKLISLQIKS